jgi:uncharacterized membrane protein YeiH
MIAVAAVVNPPVWIELPAIIAGALAGALFAQKRGLDVIGVLALAIVSGLGGGMLRDVLLARIPLALEEPMYLVAVGATAIVGGFFAQAANRMRFLMQTIDAVALGLFSVVGAQRAILVDLPIASAIMLGTITGIGGGLLRDILVGDVPPRTLRRGAPYASAAFLGASLYIGLTVGLEVRRVIAQISAVVFVCLIRGVALWRGWESPAPRDFTPTFLRVEPREQAPDADAETEEE